MKVARFLVLLGFGMDHLAPQGDVPCFFPRRRPGPGYSSVLKYSAPSSIRVVFIDCGLPDNSPSALKRKRRMRVLSVEFPASALSPSLTLSLETSPRHLASYSEGIHPIISPCVISPSPATPRGSQRSPVQNVPQFQSARTARVVFKRHFFPSQLEVQLAFQLIKTPTPLLQLLFPAFGEATL